MRARKGDQTSCARSGATAQRVAAVRRAKGWPAGGSLGHRISSLQRAALCWIESIRARSLCAGARTRVAKTKGHSHCAARGISAVDAGIVRARALVEEEARACELATCVI